MNTLKDIKKELEAIEFVFENCESMLIPIDCINKLNWQVDNDKSNVFTYLNCIIKNNGSIKSDPDDCSSPIYRLSNYDDICDCNFIFKDGSSKQHGVQWYTEDNPYIMDQNNKGQSSKMLRYNIIEILIKPYVITYTINELFEFPINTIFKDEDDNLYTLYINDKGKYIDIPMTEKYINMKYTLYMNPEITKEERI